MFSLRMKLKRILKYSKQTQRKSFITENLAAQEKYHLRGEDPSQKKGEETMDIDQVTEMTTGNMTAMEDTITATMIEISDIDMKM